MKVNILRREGDTLFLYSFATTPEQAQLLARWARGEVELKISEVPKELRIHHPSENAVHPD